MANDTCSVDICDIPVYNSKTDLCRPHWRRLHEQGDLRPNDPVIRMMQGASLEDRFWARVDKDGPVVRRALGQCWIWTGMREKSGYGRLATGKGGSPYWTHRLSYELHFGKATRLIVCHRCDNPPCVNPSHLFVGSQKDNTDDMMRKGRSARGEKRGWAVLTEADVLAIRNEYQPRVITLRMLADKYGTTPENIRAIVRRRSWTHI